MPALLFTITYEAIFTANAVAQDMSRSTMGSKVDYSNKDNSFRQFRKVCSNIADVSGYLDKTQVVREFLQKGSSGGSLGVHRIDTFEFLE